MFEAVSPAAPDAIMGLTEAFKADPSPSKINLGVGVYKDQQGKTPVLACVKAAERQLVEHETSKGYLPIDGSPDYARAVQTLLLGANHPASAQQRVATSATPGGTGALRVIGDYLHVNHPGASLWLSDPTWANHQAVFSAAGVPTRTYPYLDPRTNTLDFQAMHDAINQMPAGDVVLLHGCCHNPTGVDPSAGQWAELAQLLSDRGVLPLVDFAYQGFGAGLDEDAIGLRQLVETCSELFIASSFSKNFGLYRERVGALTVLGADADAVQAVQSQIKSTIRRNYSNPPAHGGMVVTTILHDPALTEQWHRELASMRDRIAQVRQALRQGLDQRHIQLGPAGNAFITEQKGMFTMSGLSREQVARLRSEFSIYIVGSGRINVAGIAPDNLETLCDAIAAVG